MELYCYNITCDGKVYRAVASTQLEAVEYADSLLRSAGIDKPLMTVSEAGSAWCKATPGCEPFRSTDNAASPYSHPGYWALGTGGR